MTKHFKTVDEKGCEAYVKMLQGQVEAYKIDKGTYPITLTELETADYIKAETANKSCKERQITIDKGEVKIAN